MSRLLINEYPLQVLPTLAIAIGLNEAIALQQIQYWLAIYQEKKDLYHFHDNGWWVRLSSVGAAETFPFWSKKTVLRTLAKLRRESLILTNGQARTSWYTIDYDTIARTGLGNLLLDLEAYRHFAGMECPVPQIARCEKCNTEYPFLEQHHIVPQSIGGPDITSNIINLCPNCHVWIHRSLDGGKKTNWKRDE